ncbi:hypothetical protein BTA35_0217455, partial [Oceanospirillum linum]
MRSEHNPAIGISVDKLDYQKPSETKPEEQKSAVEDLSILNSLFSAAWPDFDLEVKKLRFNSFSAQALSASYRAQEGSRQLKLHQLQQGKVTHSGTLDWLLHKVTGESAQSSLIYN